MKKEEVVKALLSAGGKSIKNLAVKNVTVAPQEKYVRLGLTLDEEVDGMITNDNGVTYERGKTKVIFVSLFSVISLLKDDDNAAFAINHLLEHPSAMTVVLSRAKIDIIQEDVVNSQVYKNPWSENNDSTVFEHDTIINHLVNIKLSEFAIAKLDKLADNLLGF